MIPFPHPPIASGQLIFLDHDDVLQKAVRRRRSVLGSHSQTIQVQSCGSAGEGLCASLSISGNPSKFLQGHNIFGSDDLLSLVADTVQVIDSTFGLGIDPFTWKNIRAGEYDLSTVDVNYSFELPSQTDVQTWIQQAEITTRSRCGRPSSRPGTVYWQKHSRRWALKAYSKWLELQANRDHQLPLQLQSTPLLRWTENILRIELRLKSLELHDLKLVRAKDFAPHVADLFRLYLRKIVMPTQLQLFDVALTNLPTRLMATYTLWSRGYNLREMMPHNTFYRHRKQLLEHGIDISIAMDSPTSSNVIPLVRVLEAKPAAIPQWAFDQQLIHRSAANY